MQKREKNEDGKKRPYSSEQDIFIDQAVQYWHQQREYQWSNRVIS